MSGRTIFVQNSLWTAREQPVWVRECDVTEALINRLFRRRSKKTSKLSVTGLCAGNSPGTAQMASYAENVSISWRHHDLLISSWTNCWSWVQHCLTNLYFELCFVIILHYENNWYFFHHIQPILLQNWLLLFYHPGPVSIPFIDLRQPGPFTQLLLVWWYQCNVNIAFMHRVEKIAAETWDVSSETGNILKRMALTLHQLQPSVSTGACRHNDVSNHRCLDCLLNRLPAASCPRHLERCTSSC